MRWKETKLTVRRSKRRINREKQEAIIDDTEEREEVRHKNNKWKEE